MTIPCVDGGVVELEWFENGGRVDQPVDRAEGLLGSGEQARGLVRIGEIRTESYCPPAVPGDGLRHILRFPGRSAVMDGDVGAGVRQRFDQGPADAAGASRHEGDMFGSSFAFCHESIVYGRQPGFVHFGLVSFR